MHSQSTNLFGMSLIALAATASMPSDALADGYLRVVGYLPYGVCVPQDLGVVKGIATVEGHHYAVLPNGKIRMWGWSGGSSVPEPPVRPRAAAIKILGQGGGGSGSLLALYEDGLMLGSKTGSSHVQFPSDQPFAMPGLVKIEPTWGGWVGLFANGELRKIFTGSTDYPIATGVLDVASDGGRRVVYRTSSNEILPFEWHQVDSNGCIDFVSWPPCGDVYEWYPFNSQNCIPRPENLGSVYRMSAGYNRIMVVRPDGTAVGWGYNNFGQCEFPAHLGEIEDVKSAGGSSIANVVLRRDGTISVWPPSYTVRSDLGRVSEIPSTYGLVAGTEARLVISDTPRPTCIGDLAGYDPENFVQSVNGEDLGILLANWGTVDAGNTADLNEDGIVDGADLGVLLNAWGLCPV
jgi:hypothetical protein